MKQVPDSLLAFQHMFPDDDACAAWLIEMRWPDGFVCPACGHEKGWALRRKAHTFECAGCRRQTSVTAGTILHASKLPLTVWFWAAYLMATHSNGISALQLQKQLGIGSYRSAWLLAHKLRASMVDPERNPLSGLVPKSTRPAFHSGPKTILPPEGKDCSHDGKMLIVGAIDTRGRNASQAACGWPKQLLLRSRQPRTLRRNRRRSPTAICENRRLVRLRCGPRRSPQCPCHREWRTAGERPSSCRGSTKSSPTSKDGREASSTGCVASICRPISMSSSLFASTAAKPATLLSARSIRLATNAEPLTYSMLIEPEPCA